MAPLDGAELAASPIRCSRAERCAMPASRWPLVIAESRALAEDAAELVEVDYEPPRGRRRAAASDAR